MMDRVVLLFSFGILTFLSRAHSVVYQYELGWAFFDVVFLLVIGFLLLLSYLYGDVKKLKELPWKSWKTVWCVFFSFSWFIRDNWYWAKKLVSTSSISPEFHPLFSKIMFPVWIVLLVISAIPLIYITANLPALSVEYGKIKHFLVSKFKQLSLKKFSINVKIILILSVVYVALPSLCFLLGWVQWYIAFPVAIMLLVGSYIICSRYASERIVRINGWEALALLGGTLICIFVADSIGFMGQVVQSFDAPYRNAMYNTLVQQPWPVFSSYNDYMVYYHAFWLPPALLSKCLGCGQWVILSVWSFVGIFLVFLVLFTRFRARTLFIFILLLFIGSVYDHVRRPFFDAYVLGSHSRNEWHNIVYTSVWVSIRDIYHATIVPLLILSLMYTRLVKYEAYIFVAAFMVACGPMQALTSLPLILIWLLPSFKKSGFFYNLITGITWLAVPVVFLSLYYIMHGNNSIGYSTLFHELPYLKKAISLLNTRIAIYVSILFFMLCPLIVIFKRNVIKDTYKILLVILSVLLPLIWVGKWHNELLFKGSLVISFLLAVVYSRKFFRSRWDVKFLLCLFFVLSSSRSLHDVSDRVVKSHTYAPELMKNNYKNDWNCHMNHKDDPIYCNFFGRTPSMNVLYDKAGESPIK